MAAALGPHAGVPEVDRAAWLALDAAREKLLPAQAPFLARLAEAVGA